jgi:tRNA(Leu) C34 or U34 (ribose-2'-O)-methylase TrmL
MIKAEDIGHRGYSVIGLSNPKTAENIGSAVRAAGCYDASMVVVSGQRYGRKGSKTDTQKAYRHIPFIQTDDLKSMLPKDCVPVAVDLIEGALPLFNYCHPERAFYVFGPEDGTLEEDMLSWCRDVVYIPTDYCMNLAATVNVVLYDRLMKNYEKNRGR